MPAARLDQRLAGTSSPSSVILPALLALLLALLLAFLALLLALLSPILPTLLAAFLPGSPFPASGSIAASTGPASSAATRLVAAASVSSAHAYLLLRIRLHDGLSCTRSGTDVTPRRNPLSSRERVS